MTASNTLQAQIAVMTPVQMVERIWATGRAAEVALEALRHSIDRDNPTGTDRALEAHDAACTELAALINSPAGTELFKRLIQVLLLDGGAE